MPLPSMMSPADLKRREIIHAPPSRGRLGWGWVTFRNSHSEIRIGLPFFSLIGKSFVDQHHRDIVLDRIEQMTGLADQTIPFAIQKNISFTFRTGQNLQKFFTDGHLYSPFLYKKKRALVLRLGQRDPFRFSVKFEGFQSLSLPFDLIRYGLPNPLPMSF